MKTNKFPSRKTSKTRKKLVCLLHIVIGAVLFWAAIVELRKYPEDFCLLKAIGYGAGFLIDLPILIVCAWVARHFGGNRIPSPQQHVSSPALAEGVKPSELALCGSPKQNSAEKTTGDCDDEPQQPHLAPDNDWSIIRSVVRAIFEAELSFGNHQTRLRFQLVFWKGFVGRTDPGYS
jgi:hypothetical protein